MTKEQYEQISEESQNQFAESLQEWFEILIQIEADRDDFGGTPHEFSDQSFFNVTWLFTHVLMNKMWFTPEGKRELSMEEKSTLVENAGRELREFIIKYTTLDMHELAKIN
jgi:hypothetical protein